MHPTFSIPGLAPSSAHILLIDDDDAVRFNMASYLEDSGFRVSECHDGEAGLAAVEALRPDLVLCDLRMPGMDGLDVVERLKERLPGLPIVVVSGTGVLSDAVEALRRGASDFISKPIQDMAVLEHAILRALDSARLHAENERFQRELEHANQRLRGYVEQLEQDATAGRILQQQMMPADEQCLNGHRCVRHLLPSLHLSGDFVDYFPIGSRYLAFYIADVSGHGVSSAFVTVLLKSLVDRHIDRFDEGEEALILDPAALLARLNSDILAQHLDKYLTMLYGVIDIDAQWLRYCNAGHFPPPVLFDGEHARFLDQRGYAVGMLAEATYGNEELQLPESYLFAMFSDGILDALKAAKLNEKRAAILRAIDRQGLHAADLLRGLGLASEQTYPDDITVLIIEKAPA